MPALYHAHDASHANGSATPRRRISLHDLRCALLERRARRRALGLGLVPNELVDDLPMNQPVAASDKSLSELDDAQPPGGMATEAKLLWMQARAQYLLSHYSPKAIDAAIDDGLLRNHAVNSAQLRLSDDPPTCLRMVAAIELDGDDEEPVEPSEVGSELIACHFQTIARTLRAFPSMRPRSTADSKFSGCNVDRFYALGMLLGAHLIDRTGTLSNGLRMKILHPIPPLDPSFNLSIDQVIERRCRELLSKHDRLHLLWSGGIDTTAVIVGFLRVATDEDWQTKLSVHYCPRSISEHPEFFERFIQPLPHHSPIDGHLRDFIDGSKVVVTGEPADMVFGTVNLRQAFRGRYRPSRANKDVEGGAMIPNTIYLALEKPWRSAVPKWLRSMELLAPGRVAEAEWLDWMSAQVDKSPVQINTLYDWIWWMGFSCKWQSDTLHIFFNRSSMSAEVLESVEHFYTTEEWQQWSYHHHEERMADKFVWASHKLPLKRYIFEFDGDQEYHAGKIKVKSADSRWGYQLGIDDQNNIVHFGRLCASRRRMEQKYGGLLERLLDLDGGGCQCYCCEAARRGVRT